MPVIAPTSPCSRLDLCRHPIRHVFSAEVMDESKQTEEEEAPAVTTDQEEPKAPSADQERPTAPAAEQDETTGQTSQKIPVPDKQTVRNLLDIVGKLFG